MKKTIREAKLVYYRREFEYNRSNIKRTWSTINDILCKPKHSHQGVKSIISNGRMINDTAEIVNKFNEFFINFGPNLISNVSRVSHQTQHKYLTRNILTSFNFSLADENHIAKTLPSLRTKDYSGHDGISTKLLKFISPALLKPLTIVINQSLITEILPDKLKIAKVIPLFKKKRCFSNRQLSSDISFTINFEAIRKGSFHSIIWILHLQQITSPRAVWFQRKPLHWSCFCWIDGQNKFGYG